MCGFESWGVCWPTIWAKSWRFSFLRRWRSCLSAYDACRAFDASKANVLELEGQKKTAEEKLEQLRKEHVELTDPVLEDEDSRGSEDSLTGGLSVYSGKRPATDLKPPPRKRRATDGLSG